MDRLLIDSFVSFTGDDIAILCSHTQGADAPAE
jgi:fructose 1,6-bisphosphatase